MSSKLPSKLQDELLVEAVFEIRFQESGQTADVLSDSLYKKLRGNTKLIRLPTADLSKPTRDADPSLRYSPVVRLDWEQFGIAIGDRSLIISYKLPYIGWNNFKLGILKIIDIVKEIEVIGLVERYSVKYVNLIQAQTISEQIKKIRMTIKIGNDAINDENMWIRVEQRENEILHILQVITGALVTLQGQEEVFGVIVDVDSIRVVDNLDFVQFTESLPDSLETLRQSNKRKFFTCLTNEAIRERGPIYE